MTTTITEWNPESYAFNEMKLHYKAENALKDRAQELTFDLAEYMVKKERTASGYKSQYVRFIKATVKELVKTQDNLRNHRTVEFTKLHDFYVRVGVPATQIADAFSVACTEVDNVRAFDKR